MLISGRVHINGNLEGLQTERTIKIGRAWMMNKKHMIEY